MAADIIHGLAGLLLRSIVVLILAAVFLAEVGLLSGPAIASIVVVVLLAERKHLSHGPTLLAVVVLVALVFAMPHRGEWIVGGWDPGVNMNQGLLTARTGGVAQAPDPVVADILREAPRAFTRATSGFAEAFPGFPVDTTTGALEPYFYRATPAWIAVLGIVDIDLAMRCSQMLILVSLVVALSLLMRLGAGVPAAVLGASALLLQPMVVYHASQPASEVLELFLVLGMGLALVETKPRPILLGVLMLASCINRVSFLLLGAILLAVVVLWNAATADRRPVSLRHLGIGVGWLLGLAWYAWVTPASTAKITHLMPLILRMGSTSLALWVLVDGLAWLRKKPMPRWFRWSALLIPAMPVLVEFARVEPWTEGAWNVPVWLAYAGWPVVALATAGLALALRRRDEATPLILWLMACLVSVLLHRHAADLYPWASKRWLTPTATLVAIGIGSLVQTAIARLGRRGLALASLAVAVSIASLAPQVRAARRPAEHEGALELLREIASHVQPTDLVVSDHFFWGTPMAMVEGRSVLNAEPLLRNPSLGASAAQAVQNAARHHKRRVLILTSTSDGLSVLPEAFRTATELTRASMGATPTRIQHRENRGFSRKETVSELTLWEWTLP